MSPVFQVFVATLAIVPAVLWGVAAALHPAWLVRATAVLRIGAGIVTATLTIADLDSTVSFGAFLVLLLLPAVGAPAGLVLARSRRSRWAWLGCSCGWLATLGTFTSVAFFRAWGDHPGTSLISSSTQASNLLLLAGIGAGCGSMLADALLTLFTALDGWAGRRAPSTRP